MNSTHININYIDNFTAELDEIIFINKINTMKWDTDFYRNYKTRHRTVINQNGMQTFSCTCYKKFIRFAFPVHWKSIISNHYIELAIFSKRYTKFELRDKAGTNQNEF